MGRVNSLLRDTRAFFFFLGQCVASHCPVRSDLVSFEMRHSNKSNSRQLGRVGPEGKMAH